MRFQISTPTPTAATSCPEPTGIDEMIRIGRTPPLHEYLRWMWERRDFLLTVSLGELRAQNQNTLLGNFWHLLNPVLLAGVYYVIFGIIFGARGGMENFAAFLVIGIFAFHYTTKVTMGGARTIVSNLRLIQNINFPRAILPVSAALQESIAQLWAIGAMLVMVMMTGVSPKVGWLMLLPIFALQALFNLGLAFLTARATFHFRDVQNVLPFVIRLWFYLSGVLYPISFVEDRASPMLFEIFQSNPIFAFISLVRGAVLDGTTDTRFWVTGAVATMVTLIGGFMFFRAHETEYGSG